MSGLSVASDRTHGEDFSEFYDDTPITKVISNYEAEFDEPSHKKLKIIDEAVAAACDRAKITDNQGIFLIGAVLRSAGLNINECTFSSSTLRRKRMEFRTKFAAQLKENLKCAELLVVHWDGKLLPKVEGIGRVERLPVVITGHNTEQLLGAPELSAGTGEYTSDAILNLLELWIITHRVKAFCFDTTSSNTGNSFLRF